MNDEPEILSALTLDGGKLFWLPRTEAQMSSPHMPAHAWNKRYAGREAGRASHDGYVRITFRGRSFYAHRIVWAMVNGTWPHTMLDHVNGDTSDNRIENLRLSNASSNAKNMVLQSRNTSGVTGIHWVSRERAWRATIVSQGRNYLIGRFKDFSKAVEARLAAEKSHGFSERHGAPKLERISKLPR